MVESCKLVLVNVDLFIEQKSHNLVHQQLLVDMTKNLTGTIATISLHTTTLKAHVFLM